MFPFSRSGWGARFPIILFFAIYPLAGVPQAGDWQPLTGDPGSGGTTVPERPITGFAPRGWDLPNLSGPPPQAPANPRPSACAISLDPPTALPGDFVTVRVSLPQSLVSRVGRVDILLPDGPAAGVVREGPSYTYAWRVPSGTGGREYPLTVSFSAYARATSFGDSVAPVCSGSAVLKVGRDMALMLAGPEYAELGSQTGLQADADHGRPPYRFVWYVDDQIERRGDWTKSSTSRVSLAFQQGGERRLMVRVEDSDGRVQLASRTVVVYQCRPQVQGPKSVTIDNAERWTAWLIHDFFGQDTDWGAMSSAFARSGNHESYEFSFDWNDGSAATRKSGALPTAKAAHAFREAKDYYITVTMRRPGVCGTRSVGIPVKVEAETPASGGATPSSPPSRLGGCQKPGGCRCPGGGYAPRYHSCCGTIVCVPGVRCVTSGVCRP